MPNHYQDFKLDGDEAANVVSEEVLEEAEEVREDHHAEAVQLDVDLSAVLEGLIDVANVPQEGQVEGHEKVQEGLIDVASAPVKEAAGEVEEVANEAAEEVVVKAVGLVHPNIVH